jgi:hypothetical protein
MFKHILPLIFLVACNSAGAQQSDFKVQFDGPQRQVPPGLIYGLNDLQNSTSGVWKAWSDGVEPNGGVVRIWLKRYLGKLNKSHIETALSAQQIGLGVMLTVVGVTGDAHKNNSTDENHVLMPPSNTRQWALELARDVKEMINAGVDVQYVEIWNEPDMPSEWDDTKEKFANFFAECGSVLRSELPANVKIGGPGMASGWGLGMSYFEIVLDACKRKSFKPDFLSWHHYGSFATDSEFLKTASLLEEMAQARGLGTPETILSEWNVSLPHPVAKGVDSNIGAAFWSAMVSSLIQTPTSHALFFFLQDGSWEAEDDYAGQSVGAFTLRGAPKAIFSAMKLMAEVAKSPAVPVKRVQAINNLTCVATRNADKGQLLVTNAPGDILRTARKHLAASGLEMGDLKGKDNKIKIYLSGKSKFEKLGLGPQWRAPIDGIKKLVRELKKEGDVPQRWVTIQLDSQPKSIVRVRLIDESHGNPVSSSSFRKLFKPYEAGFGASTVEKTIAELKRQGIPVNERAALERAFKSGSRSNSVPGVSPENYATARATFDRLLEEMKNDLPSKLAEHAACSAADVDPADWVRVEGATLRIKVPHHSIVAVDLEL